MLIAFLVASFMSRYLITISNYPGGLISLNVRGEARENLEIKLVDIILIDNRTIN